MEMCRCVYLAISQVYFCLIVPMTIAVFAGASSHKSRSAGQLSAMNCTRWFATATREFINRSIGSWRSVRRWLCVIRPLTWHFSLLNGWNSWFFQNKFQSNLMWLTEFQTVLGHLATLYPGGFNCTNKRWRAFFCVHWTWARFVISRGKQWSKWWVIHRDCHQIWRFGQRNVPWKMIVWM